MGGGGAKGAAEISRSSENDILSQMNVPGVGGVVRARLDPMRSVRRAYEYIHGVGWVLEMYYNGGVCVSLYVIHETNHEILTLQSSRTPFPSI